MKAIISCGVGIPDAWLANVYGPGVRGNHGSSLWDSLKPGVMPGVLNSNSQIGFNREIGKMVSFLEI